MASKRVYLDLEAKVKVIELVDRGKSRRDVAKQYGVGRTQINNIMKRKAEFLEDYENNAPNERKIKYRKTGNEEINELCWTWFKDVVGRNIPISGPMIQQRALKFAKDLDRNDFKACNGWLDSFIKRNNISFKVLSGESADVSDASVDDWKSKLPNLCAGYAPKDIFNMDETGLFYRDTYNKSYKVKGDTCSSGKRSKDRVTVVCCANLLGEKEQILLIGKSANPRCFKNTKIASLPVIYKNNKKAWMTSIIFEDWVKSFDKKMKRQGRKVILFMDNGSSHVNIKLSNVKMQFLPPNTTSKLQPMDQEIIQALRLGYRKKQLQTILAKMDKDKTNTGSDLLNWIQFTWWTIHGNR